MPRSLVSFVIPVAIAISASACSSPPRPPAAKPATTTPSPPKVTAPPKVVVQLAYRGTFMIGPPFSQVPPFTLLDDGTLIRATTNGPDVMTATLPHDQVEDIQQHLVDLGFEQLESHTDTCSSGNGRVRICTSDAEYTILRVELPSGERREITTYAEFSNEPKVHQAIVDYLSHFKLDAGRPYRPTTAVLHVHQMTTPPPRPCAQIDPALLRIDPARERWPVLLEGEALAAILAIAPHNQGMFIACAGGRRFDLTLLPAVPGSDLSTDLGVYRR